MIATFDTAKALKQLVDGIKHLVHDVNWQCTHEGIHFQAMDQGHVALCSVQLVGMSAYSCPEPMVLGISLANVSKVLATVPPDARLTLSATSPSALSIDAVAPSTEARFVLSLMDIEAEVLTIPPVTEDAPTATMLSAAFHKTIRDLALFGDTARITIGAGCTFEATGDIGRGSVAFGDVETSGGTSSQAFATRYLELIARCSFAAPTVRLVMPSEQPLRVLWNSSLGPLEFCLAPQHDGV